MISVDTRRFEVRQRLASTILMARLSIQLVMMQW